MVFIFAVITFFCLPVSAHAEDCDVRLYLRDLSLHLDPTIAYPHSGWGASTKVSAMQGAHGKYYYLHSATPLMKAFPGSVASHSPELINILEDVNRMQMWPKSFEHEFERVQKRLPKIDDYKDFYQTRVAIFESGATTFIQELKKTSSPLAQQIERSYAIQKLERDKAFETILDSNRISDLSHAATDLNKLMSGSITELQAAVSLANVKNVGVCINDMKGFKAGIAKRADQAMDQLKASVNGLYRLRSQSPRIFANPLVKNLNERNHLALMDRIQEWITSKEIDLIREVDGKIRWVEIKHNRDPFTLDSFKDNLHRKSPYDQIMENKEIIDFLRLSDKIEIEYLATGGMTPEVRALLESHHIKVIEAH